MKVNLACGPVRFAHDWMNIDLALPEQGTLGLCNVVADLRKGVPLPDESVDYAYSSHFLEHLDPFDECENFLTECFRVLRSGAVLRVTVPDFAKIARFYLDDPKSFYAEYDFEKPWFSRAKSWSRRLGISVMFDHKMIYDLVSLEEVLGKAGFIDSMEVGNDLAGHLPPNIVSEIVPTHLSHTLIVDVRKPSRPRTANTFVHIPGRSC